MPYIPQITIEGIQEVLERNRRRIEALQPEGAAGEAVRDAVLELHRYAISVTHVGQYEGGGALQSAHRMDVEGLEGMIYIDRGAVSPRRGKRRYRPVEYAVYEHARGGEHAFYDRTVAEAGPGAQARARQRIIEAVIYAK